MKDSPKNRMYDIEKKRSSLLFLGIIAAASLTLTAFEWRSPHETFETKAGFEDQVQIIESDLHAIIIEQEVKHEVVQKSTKSSLTQFILSDLLHLDLKDDPEPIEKKVVAMTPIKTMAKASLKGSSDNLKTNEVSTLSSLSAHQLPFMYSCATILDFDQRFKCTELAISEHLKQSIHIPSTREVKELPGLFYVQFIIDEYGAVGNLTYSKDIPKALRKEVDKAFQSIPFMQAASVNGRNVKVIFAIPLQLQRI
jgi:hypothetical protein